ncbi:hypothetical protein [Synechocystis sp. PCC 7509]|uniref:hypothetical protein n=1 Tax=Synechocystis sp. PCC 7509 TaxID=927677 RepID=UPI0002AC28C1|nr:hypothetical protein [Synechocystis sp. PCC 7509]
MNYSKLLSTAAIFIFSLSAIFPVKAQRLAQVNPANSPRQIDVTLKTQENQTFNQLIQQAELEAMSLIEQEFATNSSITEIAVTILGDRQGQQVPLLFSRVSRTDWQQQPIIRQWTKYFATSAVLLGFNQPQRTPAPPAQNIPRTPLNPPITPTPSPTNSVPQAAPISPNNAPPAASGASLEETDPGYR